MHKPSEEKNSPIASGKSGEPVHVVVAGAGPAGLLAVINLVRRNNGGRGDDESPPRYRVTHIDQGRNLGVFTMEQLKRHRSWMIGLSSHGLTALHRVPDLFEKYVMGASVKINRRDTNIAGRVRRGEPEESVYTVDRNFICAALARYIHENLADRSAELRCLYETKILYADGDNKRLLTRNAKDSLAEETYVDYDVLIGCDGIRSVVRECMLKTHRDFECHVDGIFNDFKAVHVDLPETMGPDVFQYLVASLPNMHGVGMPEIGGKINIAVGYSNDQEVDKELHSKDKEVVKNYVEKNWKCYKLADYDDFAQQWVDQEWSQSGQVHCNFYHSAKLDCLIMGDAAHATSPALGQGMNTALADAGELDRLLDRHGDDWNKVLPEFSNLRVKEGNALTSMSYYCYPNDFLLTMYMEISGHVRDFLNKWLPGNTVMENPINHIYRGRKLSVAYDQMVRSGRLSVVKKSKDAERTKHFERTTGMVTHAESSVFSIRNTIAVSFLGAGVAYFYGGLHKN